MEDVGDETDNNDRHMFEQFKRIGLYSTDVAHCITPHRKHNDHYVVTAIGSSFHTYNCSKLGKCHASDVHPADIRCLASDARHVYTGCENVVRVFQDRQHALRTLKCADDVVCVLPLHEHVVAVDAGSNVYVWHVATGEQFLLLAFDRATFSVTCAAQPRTYVNKVLFGSEQGKLQLWNLAKNRMLYEFKLTDAVGGVRIIEQTPAIDVVAIGGDSVALLNLRTGSIVMKLQQHDFGKVTSLSFSSGAGVAALMVSGTDMGHLCVWDLNERCIKSVVEQAHRAPVAQVSFLAGQPVLVSNAGDNSLRVWTIDERNFSGELLRERSGHFGNVAKAKFYDDESIITSGFDSTVRLFSCAHENKNRSLGRASSSNKKKKKKDAKLLPPVVDFAIERNRETEWDGMIALHQRHSTATTWNVERSRMGSHKLKLHDSAGGGGKLVAHVTCVDVTACGNFALVGYASGRVDLYNMQSGIFRGAYGEHDETSRKHAVVGVACDALNQVVVTAGADRALQWWRFRERTRTHTARLTAAPVFARMHRATSMLAIALDDFSLVVVDVDARNVTRRFRAHRGAVTDAAWSDDGATLVSAGADCALRVWDMSLARQVDCVAVPGGPVRSLALSPNGALMATIHVDEPGVHLWSNSSLYGVYSFNPDRLDDDDSDDDDCPVELTSSTSRQQLDPTLLTQSDLPASRWVNLADIDIIRARNKPKQPAARNVSAPFFLSSPAPRVDDSAPDVEPVPKAAPISLSLSPLAAKIAAGDDDATMELLKSLGPSRMDGELRQLAPDCGGSAQAIRGFLAFLDRRVATRRDFDLVQALLHRFLKLHTQLLIDCDECATVLRALQDSIRRVRDELGDLLGENICYVNFIKSAFL